MSSTKIEFPYGTRGKKLCCFLFLLQKKYKSVAYLALSLLKSEARVVKNVTMKITSLWPPNVYNDIVFFVMLMML